MSIYEIVVEGDGSAWERLLVEQETAAGERAIHGPEAHLRTESLGERPARSQDSGACDSPHAAGSHDDARWRDGARHLVFAPLRLTRAVLAAVATAGAADGLALTRLSEVTGAHFDFSVEVFAEPLARDIRALLAAPPPGVEVERHSEAEERESDGTGPGDVTLNAPLHCDAFRARGRIGGALPGVVEMRQRLHSLPFVQEGPIELATHPLDPAAWVEGA